MLAGRRFGARVANTAKFPNGPTAGVTLSAVPRCPLESTETACAVFLQTSPATGEANARHVACR